MSVNRFRLFALVVAVAALIGSLSLVPGSAALAAAPDTPVSTAVADPAPTTLMAAKSVEQVENPYGLDALWAQGDFVAKGTLVILVIMSIATWYVLIVKLIEQSRVLRDAKAVRKEFWAAPSVPDALSALKAGNAFRFVGEAAAAAADHHRRAAITQVDLSTWVLMAVQRSTERVQSRLQGGLAILATVGSTSPFVGLFGTVWGIYHALTAIGIAGQASIDKVAGPVGEALIMTAIGLAVAVPAVLGYNWLVRRNKGAIEEVRAFGADLHAVLISGSRPRVGAPAVNKVA